MKEEKDEIVEGYHNRVFQRGAMNFEDYNYQNFNKYILVDPDKKPEPAEPSKKDDQEQV